MGSTASPSCLASTKDMMLETMHWTGGAEQKRDYKTNLLCDFFLKDIFHISV